MRSKVIIFLLLKLTMNRPHSTSQIWICILYVIYIVALAFGVQIFIQFILNSILIPAINWFNNRDLMVKIFILLFGVTFISYILAAGVGFINTLVILVLFKNLPRSVVVNAIAVI